MATMTLAEPRPRVRGADLPYDDGMPLESEWHVTVIGLLLDILRYHWRERRDRYVAANLFVYFSPDQVKTRDFRGPDIFVVKGVRDTRMRNSWVVWEEGGLAPNYVLELASPSTAAFDLSGKKEIYERILKTPEYVVYDPAAEWLWGWAAGTGTLSGVDAEYAGLAVERGVGVMAGGGAVPVCQPDGGGEGVAVL